MKRNDTLKKPVKIHIDLTKKEQIRSFERAEKYKLSDTRRENIINSATACYSLMTSKCPHKR